VGRGEREEEKVKICEEMREESCPKEERKKEGEEPLPTYYL